MGHLGSRDPSLSATWGGFADRALARDHQAMRADSVEASEWDAARVNQVLPASVDPAAATMMITWRETFSYAIRIGVAETRRILVVGSGGNGLAFACHARNLGVRTIAMVGSALREERGRAAGATHYYDYRDEEVARTVLGELGRFPLVIDAVGKKASVAAASALLEGDGTLGIYGIEEYHELALDLRLFASSFHVYRGGYDEEESHEEVVRLVERGDLDARVWLDLDSPFDLGQIGSAFAALADGDGVKALIRIRG